MKLSELISQLQTYPQDAEVKYKDMNFGGPADDFDMTCVIYDQPTHSILIFSMWWEEYDG